MQYNKPALSIASQLKLLESRGLNISDVDLATHYLSNISYYRLAGYWYHFQCDKEKHIFCDNISFAHVINLYNFDRELRLLIFDAIERIEISFRTKMVYELSMSYGPQWFENIDLANNKTYHQLNLIDIDKEIRRSEEDFIKHHRRKYGLSEGRPPAWKTFEVLALGTLSKVYSNLKDSLPEKASIAKSLALPNHLWLQSWMLSISILRNSCAHHCRIWNTYFNYPPKKLVRGFKPWIKQLPANEKISQLIYHQLCSVKYLLNVVNPGNHFTSKLKTLIEKYAINIQPMGFPQNWELGPLWQH